MTDHADGLTASPTSHRRRARGWLGRHLAPGPAGEGPLRREGEGRIFGGVAAGIARRTGYDVNLVRAVLVVLMLVTSGYFAAGYVLAWLLVPARATGTSIGTKALADKRGIALAVAVASAIIAALVIASALRASWVTPFSLPLVVCAGGLVLVSRNAPPEERQYLDDLAGPAGLTSSSPRSRRLARVAVAVAALIAGLAVLLGGHHPDTAELLRPLAGIVLLLAAVALGLGPWWLRIVRGAASERQARIRAEERADMATRVHDSVLQTLALIQRRADDSQQVVQLARAQERELRAWLFDGQPPGALDDQATVAGAVRLIQQEVEAQHGITVEAVTVGDCDLDEELAALLEAAREAAVNAAKWSGAPEVSLFAEVEPDTVSVFVRDRGRGFDPDGVPADRKGLAESVRGRVTRRGGTATVRSAPGEGTEVSLVMPRGGAGRAGAGRMRMAGGRAGRP